MTQRTGEAGFDGLEIEGEHGPVVYVGMSKERWALFEAWEKVQRTEPAKVELPAWVVAAYVWDRREQYKPSSGTYEALSQVIAGICRGDHVEAWRHGELDDLRKNVERCMRAASPSSGGTTERKGGPL